MRSPECGMRNCSAEVQPGMRPIEPMLANPFRTSHSALRIQWLILAEHTLGGRAESTSPSESAAPCSPLPLTWHMSCDTAKDEAAVPCGRDSQPCLIVHIEVLHARHN